MIYLSRPFIGEEEKKAVSKVLDSGFLVQGPVTKAFEDSFAVLCKTKYALACSNGTAALHMALDTLGIKPGDEVITTPLTFVATANSILMAGATPVFADIDPKTYNIDVNQIEKKISRKTKAIIAVDLYGQPADYNAINALAKKHGIFVIEDAAQSVGATYHKKPSGSLADIATFSLYATKNITTGEGGMITTDNAKWYETAKLFRHHDQDEHKKYSYVGLGYNYRMTDIQAAIGRVQLKRLNALTKKRQQIATAFDKGLANIPGIVTPFFEVGNEHVYHQYILRITKEFPLTRDQFRKKLELKGIPTNIYYPVPLYNFKHLISNVNKKEFPITETTIKEIVSLPMHPYLTQKEIQFIINGIKSLAS